MFESFRGRTVTEGQRVFVYRNLHNGKWSLRAVDGPDRGRVLGHARRVCLRDAEFTVSEAGRQRVIREQCKNVHAGIVGTWEPDSRVHPATNVVRYNPYRAATFTVGYTNVSVHHAPMVELDADGRVLV